MPSAQAARLATALRLANADTAFGVPGGGPNLDVVQAMSDQGIRFILGHSETASCIMAASYGLITRRAAPVVVTRGPGAASAVNGAAQATLDRQSLVLITDTVPSASSKRVPHQRIDQRAMFDPVTVGSITFGADTEDSELAELIAEAGRWPRGAVHVDYDAASAPGISSPLTLRSGDASPVGQVALAGNRSDDDQFSEVAAAIQKAKKPVVILGVAAVESAKSIRNTLLLFGAPVLSTYQSAGVVSSEHAVCAGLFTNGATERPLLEQADLIIAVGLDMVEPIPAPWTYGASVVSLAPVPTTDPYLPIGHEVVGELGPVAARLLVGTHQWEPDAGSCHREKARQLLCDYERDSSSAALIEPIDLVRTVAASVPATATACVDAGAHFLAIMPFWPVHEPSRLLISNGLATMGYSVPASIGVALARPGEPVVSFVGDGGLCMSLAELETIARHKLPVSVVVFNDATLSLIDIKQQPEMSDNRTAVGYTLTDFAAIARSFGLEGTVVSTGDELAAAVSGGWSKPRLIDARINPSSYRHLIKVTRAG